MTVRESATTWRPRSVRPLSGDGTVPENHRRGAPRGRPEGGARGPLEAFYPVIYLDAIRVKVRADHQVSNRAAHIAVGAAVDGLLSTCWASGSKPMRGPP